MKILVYSETTAQNIAARIGQSEYSYYFVLREFLPVLQTIGEVVVIHDPAAEVDRHYTQAKKQGQACVFLSFTPPHKTTLGLRCPTIPVLAWEFDSIPNEHWLNDRKQNWVRVLKRCGCAITHSQAIVEVIKQELGERFPVISIPAPVWDKYAGPRERLGQISVTQTFSLQVGAGALIDTHAPRYETQRLTPHQVAERVDQARSPFGTSTPAAQLPLQRDESIRQITNRYWIEWKKLVLPQLARELGQWWRGKGQVALSTEVAPDPTPLPESWKVESATLELSGVVFTALFNPTDGRKNWPDMLTAFCTAFRQVPDATLVFKLGNKHCQSQIYDMLVYLARLPAFSCRVIVLNGFLQGEDFERLIDASHFAVNASFGEGQCLPLMEFLSSGKPAIAPQHSALCDYIDSDVGFIVESWAEVCSWPQDVRTAYRTRQQQINWESLVRAYERAYHCVKQMPEQYTQLARTAVSRMQDHCSQSSARAQLLPFLQKQGCR